MKYRTKPKIVDIISFEELIEYGIKSGAKIISGIPTSFKYCGLDVDCETTSCCYISTKTRYMYFLLGDFLVTSDGNFIAKIRAKDIEEEYELAE
jgi:hypothetical protein